MVASGSFAFAAAPPDPSALSPVIESIEGDKIVIVKKPAGNTVGEKGTFVNFGDRIKTGPRASAKIRYPDGSKLLIGRASEMEIQDSKNGVQYNELKSGEVRGIIAKPRGLVLPNAPPRFVIRSRSAVMGVRGTDFVMNLDEELAKTELHTLEGTVELASDEATLMQGKGVRIEKDQSATAESGKIAEPATFDRKLYDLVLEASQPEFVSLTRNDVEIAAHNTTQLKAPDGLRVTETMTRTGMRLFQFSLNSLFLKQNSGGQVSSGQASWNPTLYLLGIFALRGHAGFTLLKGRTQSDRFVASQFGIILGLELLDPILLEVGGGNESWGDHGNSSPYGMASLAYRLGGARFVERIFVGVSGRGNTVSTSLEPRNGAISIRAGVGVQF